MKFSSHCENFEFLKILNFEFLILNLEIMLE